jgi:hypothetical protein
MVAGCGLRVVSRDSESRGSGYGLMVQSSMCGVEALGGSV